MPEFSPLLDLTPLQRAFADAYLGDAHRCASAAYLKACEAVGEPPDLEKADDRGKGLVESPAVAEYLKRRQEELAARALLTQERVLMDIMELRDLCLGRKPMPMAAFHDGELVTGVARKLDAGGAAKTLELLGKYLAMWTDNVKHSAGEGSPPALFVLNLGGPPDAVPAALEPAA
jgi:phage terminase small subunit